MGESGLKVRCLASTGAAYWTAQSNDFHENAQRSERMEIDHENPTVPVCTTDLAGDAILGGILHELHTNSASSRSSSSSLELRSDRGSMVSSSLSLEHEQKHTSSIQDAQLSPDGSCIFTSDYDRTFSVYPLDASVASGAGTRALQPYASYRSPNPIWAFAANPLFRVDDANSTHVLVSRRDSYITLHNALWDVTRTYDQENSQTSVLGPVDIKAPVDFYKLINHLTEAVTAPISLAYSHDGAHFFAGKQNGIATFDLEHTEDPIHTIDTIPSKRNKLKGGGRGFKGWISALSLSPPTTTANGGLLAAGARTRYVGIYDAISGTDITQFSLPGTIDGKKLRNENLKHIMGDGVSHLKWSPCGKYLYVAERQSDVLLIYDARKFSLTLGHCSGRKALTKQKLGFDIWNAGASPYDIEGVSHEVWAGGTDGKIRVWKDPYIKEGAIAPDEVVKIHETDVPVVSPLVHPSGSVAVAASGMVKLEDESTSEGMRRGGGIVPRFREWGRLDILSLG